MWGSSLLLVGLLLMGCTSPTEPCLTTNTVATDTTSGISTDVQTTYCVEARGMVP